MEKNLESSPKSHRINAQSIRNQQFKKAMWGYAPGEVAEFLDGLAKEWEKVELKEKELSERIRSVNDELLRWKAKESEIERLKEEAHLESEKYFREVEDRAKDIRQKTEEWLAQVLADVEETERRKQSFVTAFRSALDSHYELLKDGDLSLTEAPLGERLTQLLSRNAMT